MPRTHISPTLSPITLSRSVSTGISPLPQVLKYQCQATFPGKKKPDFSKSEHKRRADYCFLLWTAEKELGYNITSTKNVLLACTLTHFYLLPTISHPRPTHASKHPPRLFRTKATSKCSCSTSLYSSPRKDTAEFHVVCTYHTVFTECLTDTITVFQKMGSPNCKRILSFGLIALHYLIITDKELNLQLEAVTTPNKLKGPHSH